MATAFSYCSGIVSVTIPEGVTLIDRYAFRGCRSLTTAIFLGDAPELFNPGAVFADARPAFSIF